METILDYNYFEQKEKADAKLYIWRPHALAKDLYWRITYSCLCLLLVGGVIYQLWNLFTEGFLASQLWAIPMLSLIAYLIHLLKARVIIRQEDDILTVVYCNIWGIKQRKTFFKDDIQAFYESERGDLLIAHKGDYEFVLQQNHPELKLGFNPVEMKKLSKLLNANWQKQEPLGAIAQQYLPKVDQVYDDPTFRYILKEHQELDNAQSFFIKSSASIGAKFILGLLLLFLWMVFLAALIFPTEHPLSLVDLMVKYVLLGVCIWVLAFATSRYLAGTYKRAILFQDEGGLRVKTSFLYGLIRRVRFYAAKEIEGIFIRDEEYLYIRLRDSPAKEFRLVNLRGFYLPDMELVEKRVNEFLDKGSNE
jgi:hypothetical protein